MPKTAVKVDQSMKDPLESDLNTLFQSEEDLITKKRAYLYPSRAQHCEIPDHLKSLVDKCGIVLV